MTHDHEHDDHEHDHEHDHDEPQGHEHDAATHGTDPLPGVDPADLHAAVDALAGALHEYVATAVGVRAEFGAEEADEDPRILALESRVGGFNAALYDLLHDRLGMHADLVGMTWDDDGDTADDATDEAGEVDAFHVGLVVSRTPAAGDRTLDSVLDLVEAGASDLTQTLVEAGFEVVEWGVSRGAAVDLGEDEDDEDGA
ncbi:hypothetical protein KIN34_00355 [Cellulomonas sp. DKR-3]|uniref:Uncharacterized protein n=1 Tax=Cellulomonas fulva TaxID=2835530 RepID=A0ABS5TUC4_9CELL|nr:hypothetical protein [Cellulomonas fulva]MBT0992741.1 hypothetical protein [Cellulomonas fulva]